VSELVVGEAPGKLSQPARRHQPGTPPQGRDTWTADRRQC
jgi:hypothetical protein